MPDPVDGLPAMVVGRWVTEEKHRIIARYIDASWAARQKFTSQRTYIDLFAGTGRVKIKHTQAFQDGGPLAAWQIAHQRRGAFSDFFIADANQDFLAACDARLRQRGAPLKSKVGRADETIDWVLPQLNKRGFHLALLDPFNAGHLHFSIIEKLATMPTMDIVVHLVLVISSAISHRVLRRRTRRSTTSPQAGGTSCRGRAQSVQCGTPPSDTGRTW
ncbi:MAG: hypothetical protein CPSOU_3026 [uncultured Paraburkholderia sp.]|nr:MAG: hypothetical protein CPSOU_3026 [uncultured Paraburkholderia sp.]